MTPVETAAPPALACRLVAFDTATESSSIALVAPSGILTLDAPGGARASTSLLPDVLDLLQRAGLRLQQLDAIAFGCGPGAFTGLRTACSVAQGMAFGAGMPVMPVDSLMMVAESVRNPMAALGIDTVWVAQDARMEEIYAAAYRWQGERPERWQTLVAPALYTLDAMNVTWQAWQSQDAGRTAVAGSALTMLGSRLGNFDSTAIKAAAAGSRAWALAQLSISQWHDGIRLDAAQAVPLYLRDKVALTTAEREVARAARVAA